MGVLLTIYTSRKRKKDIKIKIKIFHKQVLSGILVSIEQTGCFVWGNI
jgi:hypothetical protein